MAKYIKHKNGKLYLAIFDTYGLAVSISNGSYTIEKQTSDFWLKIDYKNRCEKPEYNSATEEEFNNHFRKALTEIQSFNTLTN